MCYFAGYVECTAHTCGEVCGQICALCGHSWVPRSQDLLEREGRAIDDSQYTVGTVLYICFVILIAGLDLVMPVLDSGSSTSAVSICP